MLPVLQLTRGQSVKPLLYLRTFILALILTIISVGYTMANVVVIPLLGDEFEPIGFYQSC